MTDEEKRKFQAEFERVKRKIEKLDREYKEQLVRLATTTVDYDANADRLIIVSKHKR